MRNQSVSFRVGKVQAYLCYHDNGQHRRPRVGPDREAARQLAAQVNAQLEVGAPAALSFEPITVPELRRRWLEHHELVLRSSVRTIQRYRTATDHLLGYLPQRPVRYASQFHASHAEQFVRHLRSVKVSPNTYAAVRLQALPRHGRAARPAGGRSLHPGPGPRDRLDYPANL